MTIKANVYSIIVTSICNEFALKGGGHLGVPIGTNFLCDIVFRALKTIEIFDLCGMRYSMNIILLALVMMCGSVKACPYTNIQSNNKLTSLDSTFDIDLIYIT